MQVLRNSDIPFTFKLVDVARLDAGYHEQASFTTMLEDVRTGKLPIVETGRAGGLPQPVHLAKYRDEVGADLVSLLVATADGENGASWTMRRREQAFADRAFSVVSYLAATGHLSLAHELGHNFGCCHDRANHQGPAPLVSYAYGHRLWIGPEEYVTIMADGSHRIEYYSNPEKGYGGVRSGVPLGQQGEAYNAKVMTESAPTVAKFRTEQVP
jgi:hypothetical protein